MTDSRKKLNMWLVLAFAILVLFLIFVVYPPALVLYKSVLMEDGTISFDYFVKFFSKKYYWSTLLNSFKVTIVSTLVSAILGLIMAFVLRSVKIRGSGMLNILIVISYLSPPFIGAYAWVTLLGRNGFITRILNAVFNTHLNGIYGFSGIVLAFSMQSFPLVYMYISGALKNMDNSLNEAAESLGCTVFQRVRKIIVPLVMPSLLASSLLVFMRVFSDFGTPMLIGEGYKTFPVLLYSEFMGEVNTDDHYAAALCVIVITITLVLFFLQKYIGNRLTYSMSALKPMEAKKVTGLRNILAHAFVYLVVTVAALPPVDRYRHILPANKGGFLHRKDYAGKLQEHPDAEECFDNHQYLSFWAVSHPAGGGVGDTDIVPDRTEEIIPDGCPGYPDHVPVHHTGVRSGYILPVCL